MVIIEEKRMVFSTSFVVKNDQEARVDVPIEGGLLKLGITFKSGTPSDQRTGEWTQEKDVVRFSFTGWNNPLGTCVVEPTKFGDVAGKRMYFQLAHHYVGEQNLAHLFIFVGA